MLSLDADSAVSSGPGYRGQLVPRIYVMTSQKFLLFFEIPCMAQIKKIAEEFFNALTAFKDLL